MIALETVLSRLDGPRPSGRGWIARCPAHSDRQPSLKVDKGAHDRVLLYCFAGCAYRDVVRALGLEAASSEPLRVEEVDIHTRGLRIALTQPWADPLARNAMEASRHVRLWRWRAEVLRQKATAIGPTPAAWDALELAARFEREAGRMEYLIDEALS